MKKDYKRKYGTNARRKAEGKDHIQVWIAGIVLGILFLFNLFYTHGDIVYSLQLLAVELACLAALLLAAFLWKMTGRRKKKRTPEGRKVKRKKRSGGKGALIHVNFEEPRYSSPKERNFNWVVEEAKEEQELPQKPVKVIPAAEEKKPFVPYRSPFDPLPSRIQDDSRNGRGNTVIKAAFPVETLIPAQKDMTTPVEDSKAEKPVVCETVPEVKPGGYEEFVIQDVRPYRVFEYSGPSSAARIEEQGAGTTEQIVPESHTLIMMEDWEDEEAEVTDEADVLPEPTAQYETDIPPVLPERLDIQEEITNRQTLAPDTARVVLKREPSEFRNRSVNAGNSEKEGRLARQHDCTLPSMELLKKNEWTKDESLLQASAEVNAKKLVDTLASFGVGAKVIHVSEGPSVTRYELQPNVGVKVSRIVSLADDIALNLAATGVRIEAPIPGKAAIGIEVPNKEVRPVLLRDVIESPEFFNHPSKLSFAVGKDIAGNTIIADIAKMPHLLIAGATGSGKSVCINTLVASILYKAQPSEVRLLMVDPKVVELSIYNGIPHLLIPVVTDPKKAAGALNWAVQEMTGRYKLFADNNVRDLRGYNGLLREKGMDGQLPQIVIIIDELADLMMVAPNDVEDCICRLAQMARAAGMHLVIATQRPSVDVITGLIKANVPSRISFAVSSQIDSRTILDMAGAEKLLGRGDMLFNPIGLSKPLRVQGAFISDKEVESIVACLKSNTEAQYDEDILQKIERSTDAASAENEDDNDDLLPAAIDMVVDLGQASTSMIQRKFKVGYSRAARIVDQMEARGIVGPFDGSKPRQVLVSKAEWMEMR
jgi:DNA segregation ATPase FtsK/SpoIIIE, S-DNA-T family